jgi:hypothetical protein
MKNLEPFEREVVEAYEAGTLRSVGPSRRELKRLRAAARATSIKDRRVNIRLSSADLSRLRARALEEGLPYQTLIASVLHKFVGGHLIERPARPARRSAPRRAGGSGGRHRARQVSG